MSSTIDSYPAEKALRVIIRAPNWLGDCIMALPFLQSLKRARPNWKLTILARRPLTELFEFDGGLENVIALDDKGGRLPIIRQIKISSLVRHGKYDLGLILPDSFSSALIFYLAGIPARIGYCGDGRSIMLTTILNQPATKMHRSQKYMGLLSALGIHDAIGELPDLPTGESAGPKAAELLGDTRRFVVIAPHSNAPARRWGEEKYSALIALIKKTLGLDLVLIGAPAEAALVEEVGRRSGVAYLNLAGRSSLLTSCEIMKRAMVYIGNDSGGAHLAAAAGTCVISLSGADDPDETRPLARTGRVIRKPLPCSPCVKNICPRQDQPMECMQLISVDEVLAALRECLHE